jgi:hypothetical protein
LIAAAAVAARVVARSRDVTVILPSLYMW